MVHVGLDRTGPLIIYINIMGQTYKVHHLHCSHMCCTNILILN